MTTIEIKPHLYPLQDLTQTPTRLKYLTKGHNKWNGAKYVFNEIAN